MESVERRMMLAADVVISEFMAANTRTLADRDGQFSDWIEINNRGDAPADLSGWYLTDDPADLTQWAFPAGTILGPGQYLIVFATEKLPVPGSTELHADFKLEKSGEYLAIVRSDGLTIDHEYLEPFAEQTDDVSYGLARPDAAEDELAFFTTPSPGQPNPVTLPTSTLTPGFSEPSQTFAGSLTVTLTTTSPTAQIRYTTNRSTPNAASTLYTGPITINANTVLRARVFEPGKNPGPVVSRTYIAMAANVQSFESNLPVIVLERFGQGLNDRTLTPVGAYVIDTNPLDGRARMTDLPQYAGLSGLRLRGQSSQGFPKAPYAFETWDEAGRDLDIPLLGMPADSDWVLYNPYSEKSLMQNHLAYTWARKQGNYASRTRFIEVFVNSSGGTLDYGDYAGIYILEEKIKIHEDRVDIEELGPNDNQGQEVTGGYIFKIDKTDSGESYWQTNRGQRFLYAEPEAHELTQAQKSYLLNYLNSFESALYGQNFRDPVLGYQAYIDVDSFIDHHIMVEMAKNIDGFRISTYFSKDRGGKIKMEPIWDYNLSMGNANYNSGQDPTGWYYQQAGLGMVEYAYFPRLFQDPDFAQRYSDRWQELRRTVFETSQMMADIDAAVQVMTDGTNVFPSGTNPQQPSVNALVRNFKRWQILGQHVWPNAVAYSNWTDELTYLKNFLIQRWNWIDSQYLGVPTTNRSGEKITGPTFYTMTPPSGAQVYYTTDGSDPRLSGGGISPKAVLYTGPMMIDTTTRIRARSYQLGRWSDDIDHSFVKDNGLRVSELMYHPPNPPAGSTKEDDAFEFIELHNAGTEPIDLSGYRFDLGIDYIFPAGSVLEPGGYRVIVSDAVAFADRYPGIEVHGMYAGRFDDSGERVRLLNAAGAAIIDFTYGDGGAWPGRADGEGSSLETVTTNDVNLSSPVSWRSSTVFAGTPGGRPSLQAPGVVINEVLARSTAPDVDAIELYNPTGEDVDLSGWYLSDSRTNFRKFQIPDGTIIRAGGYLVFDEHDFNPTPENPQPHHFALDGSRGDDVWLVKTDAQGQLHTFVDGASFHGGAAAEGGSVGRTRDGSGRLHPLLGPTLGGPNRPPTVGKVLISEVMYNHQSLKEVNEFIELHNASTSPVNIGGWRLAGGVDYVFPAGTMIPAFGELIVVPFNPLDPREAPRLSQFRSAYGLSSSAPLIGGFSGRLDNAGDNVRLERPDVPMPGQPGQFVYLVVDDVGYEPAGAWPTLPDGRGASLTRMNPQGNGHGANNWSAPDPSPGTHTFGDFVIPGSDADDVYHVRLSEDGTYLQVLYGTRTVSPAVIYAFERAGRQSLAIDAGAGRDQLLIDLSAPLTPPSPLEVVIPDAGGADSLQLNGPITMSIGENRKMTDLVVSGGARLTFAPGIAVETDGLLVGGGGSRLDINSGRLLVRRGSLTGIETAVTSGRAGGAGIVSSAIGNDPLTTIAVIPIDEDVLVRYTYHGDANGDGRVNADDYFRIDSGFLGQPNGPAYADGDFNYDDKVNADDYFLIDSAYLGQGQPLAAAPSAAVGVTSSSSSSAVASAPALFSTTTIATKGRKTSGRPVADESVLKRSLRRPVQRATPRIRS